MNIRHDYVCYTDGSYSNGKTAIGGVVINIVTGERQEFSHALQGEHTINVAELAAVKKSLESIPEHRPETRVVVYTDSQYVEGVLFKGWKAKSNKALIAKIQNLMVQFGEVKVEWQRAHIGHGGNERADRLAKKGREARKSCFVGLDPVPGDLSTFEVTCVYDAIGKACRDHYSVDEVVA